ncbi:MAG: hypothetical protein V1494_00735 [Candidatus Diapherotrites archaeon]
MQVITTRVGEKFVQDLKEIEKDEKADRAEVVRKLLASAIGEWKLKKAIGLLRERKITLRTAAKIADVSYATMLSLVSSAAVDSGYSLKDLETDLERI